MRIASTPDDDVTAKIAFARPEPTPVGVVLRVLDAQATPSVMRLTTGTCIVGSGPSSDIVITERTVSRAHLSLELVPEGVIVRDLGSRNGTFYRGQRIEKMVLGASARLTVGGVASLVVQTDLKSLRAAPELDRAEYQGMTGVSGAMRRIFAMLARLEGSLLNVLVEGESGVGKELIARAVHQGSTIAGGPLTIVNCGAIPRELAASELFGHRRGAFTGAVDARRGAFECADGGTLFLDEIGELPLDVQPMLLRALETGDVSPVGGDQRRRVKVRVVSATNRDLEQEVRRGRFREDLFYRLAVLRFLVPPLRERPEDIAPLARRFARAAGIEEIPADVLAELESRPWPGNARELRNVVHSFAALGALPDGPRTQERRERSMSSIVDLERPFLDQRDALVDRFAYAYLEALLAHTGGNQTAAARLAGLDRTYLGRLLAKYRLTKS